MKKFLKSFSVVGGIGFGLVLGVFFTTTGMAQESTQENILIQKIDDLVTALQGGSNQIPDENVQLQSGFGFIEPNCLQDITTLPKSRYKKDSDWDISKLPVPTNSSSSEKQHNFLDLNGDGLLDVLYYKAKTGGTPNYIKSQDDSSTGNYYWAYDTCVMLNNGAGWDVVYRCSVYDSSYKVWFYGDCADI